MEHLKAEILRLEREAGNLVRFLAEGGESTSVRGELQGIESVLQGLRLELAGREAMPSVPPRAHPTWMRGKLERLDELLRQEPAQAKAEIAKHLDGELTVRPPFDGTRAAGGDQGTEVPRPFVNDRALTTRCRR